MSAVVREQDDKLRLIRLDRSRSDGGKTAVLELKNLTSLELVRLPFSYTGAFAESAPSDRRLYTLGHTQQRRERSIVMTCLSVCLCACHISGNTRPIVTNFYAGYPFSWLGPPLAA